MRKQGNISNEMKITLPAIGENEGICRAMVGAFVSRMNPTIEELADIKCAVSEAVTNCIVHAYKQTIGTIQLKCRILPGGVLDIVVKDRGCGIEDVAQARKPMFSTGGAERSGMGFTIMESFMTELKVSSTPGKGTTVHMKRKIVQRGGSI